jgi:hypothetical protein
MVATAKIQVNNSRNSGNVSGGGEDVQREILSELKKMNDMGKKQSSMSASGLLKTGGILGGLMGAALTIPGAVGGAADSFQYGTNAQKDFGYSKVMTEDGQTQVAKINQTNGEIVDLLTMQEAVEQGILNDKFDIKEKHKVVSTKWDQNIKGLESSKDAILLSNEQLEKIADLETEEKLIQKDINEQKKKKLESMGGDSRDYTQGFSSSNASLNTSTAYSQHVMQEANKVYTELDKVYQKTYGTTLPFYIKP